LIRNLSAISLGFSGFQSKAGEEVKTGIVFSVLFATLGQGTAPAGVSAQDAPKNVPPANQEPAKDVSARRRVELDELKQAAASYRIAMDSDQRENAILVPEPVLHWSNPLRQTSNGAVFIWVADGRPEVVASLYRYTFGGKMIEDHEFQSLATIGLTATRNGQTVWAPRIAGVSLIPIPGAARPAPTSAERLRQMQALAREFHAFFDTADNKSELRLLPKPLYRYETKNPSLRDGALFAFVVTTDPEVLLTIEARPIGGELVWHYGFARMSMVNLRAQHKGQTVWNADWVYDLEAPNKPYVTLRAPDRIR
jgi:hypothetical protein